jgi:enediyne biosynthesis protein E4
MIKNSRFYKFSKISYCICCLLFFCSCTEKEQPLFTILQPSHSAITFENKIEETPEINILAYEYTYNGGGVAAGDFNNDGLCDLYFSGNAVKNQLYRNQKNLKFKNITETAGVEGRSLWKTGVTVADVNGDGWLDIYVCYSGPDAKQSLSNELYINNGVINGDPTFTERAIEYGLDAPGTYSTQAAFFDYERDGDLDMFLINHGNHFYSPFINTNKLRNTRHSNFGNRLYRHDTTPDSKHYFTEVSEQAGIHGGGINFSLGLSISDVNNDGWPDIYVTNDYEEQDFFYLNNRNGSFVESTKNSFEHISRNGMGTDLADYNNDGKIDLIEVDMWPEDNFRQKLLKGPDDYYHYQLMLDSGFHQQQMRNTLQLNTGVNENGVPIFSEVGQLAGVSATDWSWAPLFLDADNDGLKDLFITNGYLRDFTSMDFLKFTVEDAKKQAKLKGEELKIYELVSKMSSTKTSDYLYKNNGNLTFSNFTEEWGMDRPNLSFGAAYADLDNDGDLELITNNTNEVATVWENHQNEKKANSYLRIKLNGAVGNNFGIGAKVIVEANGTKQFQELFATRGFQSSVEPILHFGLGENQKIANVRVVWADGKQSVLENQKVNSLLEISYSTSQKEEKQEEGNRPLLFKDISKQSGVDFTHRENEFVDFDKEPLIPYQLSQSGPALAKGDANNDGAEDFYIGGAAGQKSVLYLSDGNGKFTRSLSQPWEVDAAKEDTGAVFFDVDGDHDLDLFVVSGGNEFENGSTELEDRLYLNLGNGKFSKADPSMTTVDHVSGSCVVAGDYDKDGDIDLFVGGSVLPRNFPLSSPSAILKNESNPLTGEIKLVVATKEVNAAIREIGMVTDAIWTDFNNDNWLDLMIVGEWMPIRLFENKMGKLVEVVSNELQNSSGLWNRVAAADVDHDGDIDYVIGNAGINLPWYASMQEPLTLYYGDFNGDGRIDPIICHYNQGKSFPVASRDELLLQMNSLRKKYTSYSSYAEATIEDVLGVEQAKSAKKCQVNTLQSCILENVGKDNFKLKPLPMDAQVSSVRGILIEDFNGDNLLDMLLAGNFYPFRTQYGPSDASKGLLLTGNGNGSFSTVGWEESGFYCPGDVRNMVLLNSTSKKRSIIVGKNNGSTLVVEH